MRAVEVFRAVAFLAGIAAAGPVRAGEGDPPATPPTPAEAASVEERLNRLEETNAELLEVVRELKAQNEALARELQQRDQAPPPPVLDRSLEGGVDSLENPVPAPTGPLPPSPSLPGAAPGMGTSPGALDRAFEGGIDSIENPVPGNQRSWRDGRVRFGPGVMLESMDGEFQLQFHNQTQLESRIYDPSNMYPAAANFDIPRQRFIFNGRYTKNIEFDASIEAAYGTINLLNAFLNFKPNGSEQVMFKFGRYKVPYLYEYYAISNADLLTPERSLFGINFGFNRMPGGMVWGSVLDKRVDYAVGIFDGARNQQLDFNNDKDVIAYLNVRPFLLAEDLPFLKNLNVGGSIDAGSQNNAVVPRSLKTSVSQSTNVLLDDIGPSWLVFNPDARERGWRTFYSLHGAYFYRQLSVLGEWSLGFQNYGFNSQAFNTRVPIDSFYVAAGYMLTGEEVTRRTQVIPKQNFSLRPGQLGLGAWELVGRYSTVNLGEQVFTNNLVDPALWSNTARATEVGLNWYWNPYLKIYMFWQHSNFGDPVLYNTITQQKVTTSDLYWLRFQFVY